MSNRSKDWCAAFVPAGPGVVRRCSRRPVAVGLCRQHATRGGVIQKKRPHDGNRPPTMNESQQPAASRETLEAAFPILEFFRFAHLQSEKLRETSRPFCELALAHAARGLESRHRAEVAAGLRKLLEAKDCLVRAALS